MYKFYKLNNIKLVGGSTSVTTTSDIQVIELPNGMNLKLINFLGRGAYGEIYEIKLYDSKMNEIKYDKDICVKVSYIYEEEEKQIQIDEFRISLEMGIQNIGPKMYHHFIIDDTTIKSKINSGIYKINLYTKFRNPEMYKYFSIIIMQKLDGYTLGQTIEDPSKELTTNQKSIICDKITKMHSLGFIHNDLHTYNIFIDKQEPYIIDYGLSNYIDPSDRKSFRPIKYLFKPEYYFKTLGNLLTTSPQDITAEGSFNGLTVNDQYCKQADWSCERGVQSKDTFFMCNPDRSEAAKIRMSDDNQSGYLTLQHNIQNLFQLQPLQETIVEIDEVHDNESSIQTMTSDLSVGMVSEDREPISSIPEMRMSQSVGIL